MNWISLGAVFGGLSVMLGAFGAHSLKEHLTEQKLATFQTGTQYMGYHALALVLVGILVMVLGEQGKQALKKVGIFFTVGIVLFSGSLYALAFDGPRFFGPVTPLGGLFFMIGWFTMAVVVAKLLKAKN
jgi:uncharacterized membrane protein YgdD (TMEM256/DUF423 family)